MIVKRKLKHLRNSAEKITKTKNDQTNVIPCGVLTSGPDCFTHSQPLNHATFDSVILRVTLDNQDRCFGQSYCNLCKLGFIHNTDNRVLRCEHVFHGPCIYQFMIVQNQQFCPVCSLLY